MKRSEVIDGLYYIKNWECHGDAEMYGIVVAAIEMLEQPEVIYCGNCTHYKPMSNNWGTCGVHSSPTEKYRTCQICDHCSWAERKTDG